MRYYSVRASHYTSKYIDYPNIDKNEPTNKCILNRCFSSNLSHMKILQHIVILF